jgi:formylglycine-generating enzyme required for sulfatase activity
MNAPAEARYRSVRLHTAKLCAPLSAEDQQLQPMADASPTKWHLAHTTWFFEAFVLGGPPFDPVFEYLFNSYYEAVGPRVERARRGMLSRPGLVEVRAYRDDVDRRVACALVEGRLDDGALARLELGLHHEQQHQELILTDIKYALGTQPLRPAYRADLAAPAPAPAVPLRFCTIDPTGLRPAPRAEPAGAPPRDSLTLIDPRRGGAEARRAGEHAVVRIGAAGGGFAFDNERPAHDVLVRPFRLAARPISNGDVLAFIADGGYREPRLWLSDGWHAVQAEGWQAPLYWDGDGGHYTLGGVRAIDPAATACHLSYYEADAIARWLGGRLPTEAEWEVAARGATPELGNFADDGLLCPAAPTAGDAPAQLFGDVWEWTASAYAPYPGFRPLAGALGEYNGKFMSGQQVLRGGSCLTPRGHVRATYRNFFPPGARWQMSGARVARDAEETA